jgi:hypothetical protein
VYKSDCRATIRSLNANGGDPERDVSSGTAVLPYEGRRLDGVCACGCGRIVVGERSTRVSMPQMLVTVTLPILILILLRNFETKKRVTDFL